MSWIDMKERTPEDEQSCLTDMKHGLIEGVYWKEDRTFRGYYWHDMEWYASRWVPIEEVK